MKSRAILQYVTQNVWALEPNVAQRMLEVLNSHFAGDRVDEVTADEVVAARARLRGERAARDGAVGLGESGAEERRAPVQVGGVRVVPVDGFLTPYASMINGMSQPGGTTVQAIEEWLADAIDDPSVRCVLLDIDSPGGTAAGMDDLGRAVKEADSHKPVYAYAHDQATSAAYLAGSQARRFYASSMAAVGSIGVLMMVPDTSARDSKSGVKLHLVRSAPFKGAGMSGVPVTESDLASIQTRVDQLHSAFVKMVADGRGLSVDKAAALADGRSHIGADAARMGYIDGVRGYRQLLAELDSMESGSGGGNGGSTAKPSPVWQAGRLIDGHRLSFEDAVRETAAADGVCLTMACFRAAKLPEFAQLYEDWRMRGCPTITMTAAAGEDGPRRPSSAASAKRAPARFSRFEDAARHRALADGIPIAQGCFRAARDPQCAALYQDWKDRGCPPVTIAAAAP